MTENKDLPWKLGTIFAYYPNSGFGYIRHTESLEPIYFHYTDYDVDRDGVLAEGQKVRFRDDGLPGGLWVEVVREEKKHESA